MGLNKTDISFKYSDESIKISQIFANVNRRTTGNISWTSASSGIVYNTATSTDINILNKGEAGLMILIQNSHNSSKGWIVTAKDINDMLTSEDRKRLSQVFIVDWSK